MYEAGLTPVQECGGWWAKREDLACFTTDQAPSGAKVRQYRAMIDAAPADAVLAVGCAAASAMQVYVAAAGQTYRRDAYVALPARKKRHPSTLWAYEHGAQLREVAPGWPSQYRAAVRQLPEELGRPVVRWDRQLAALDTAQQVRNLPTDTRRIVIPSGSGLTAAGVLIGLSTYVQFWDQPEVVVIATSGMAAYDGIVELAGRWCALDQTIKVTVVPPAVPYTTPVQARLPHEDATLDPWYAAKGVAHVRDGDVLWVVGRRPPSACRR